MRFDTLTGWLQWLESFHPSEIELGLERISAVSRRMCLEKPGKLVVTVAGTNGKGTTVAALESILVTAGLRVGSYTSPHLSRYNERVKIDGKELDDSYFCRAFVRVDASLEDLSLTYFEFGTLAALSIFSEFPLDVVLLEVGLGGRLDAVNIVDADIAVITKIDIDHVDWLGDNRERIGREKAGILRTSIPLVCADDEPPNSVIEMARQLDCSVYCIGKEFSAEVGKEGDLWSWHGVQSDRVDINSQDILISHLHNAQLPLASLAAAIQVIQLINSFTDERGDNVDNIEDFPASRITTEDIRRGISAIVLPGRLQYLPGEACHIVLDVAHNKAGAEYLSRYLLQHPVEGNTYAVFAVMADKDIHGIIAALRGLVSKWFVADLEIARAASSCRIAREADLPDDQSIEQYPSVESAFRQAVAGCNRSDRVVVFGSFFTVAAVLNLLDAKQDVRL
jgi:dihydrofolate synthase/folylpolyglutamate synthase